MYYIPTNIHNPPEGDRREVVPFRENRDLEGFARAYLGRENSSLLRQMMHSERYTSAKEAPRGNQTHDITQKSNGLSTKPSNQANMLCIF